MPRWYKTDNGSYVNLDYVRVLYLETPLLGQWRINADLIDTLTDVSLSGNYTTEALAQTALDRLTQGFDPDTI